MARGLDPTSDRAAYRQIADSLRADIQQGRLAPGERLPSETELMEQFGAARGTVRQAVSLLRGEGLVRAEQGRGAFVRSRPPMRRLSADRLSRRHREAGRAAFEHEAASAGRASLVEVLRSGPGKIEDEDVARRLGLRRSSKVLVRARRYLADGEPLELATSYVPWEIAAGTRMVERDTGPGGLYARLEEAGHRLTRFNEEVSARMPSPGEARALQLADGVPVISVVRTAYDEQERAVEVCDTTMAADRYTLSYDFPAS